MKKRLICFLFSALFFSTSCLTGYAEEATNDFWVKQIEINNYKGMYILKSNGDLMVDEGEHVLKKVAGNVDNFIADEGSNWRTVIAVRKDGSIYAPGLSDDDRKMLEKQQARKVSLNLSFINNKGELWKWDTNKNEPVKFLDHVAEIKTVKEYSIRDIALLENGDLYDIQYKDSGASADIIKIFSNVSRFDVSTSKSDYVYAIQKDGALSSIDLSNTYNNYETSKILDNICDIKSSADARLALSCDGQLWGWGSNNDGQLGNDSRDEVNLDKPIQIIDKVKKVALGRNRVAVVRENGEIWTWGYNNSKTQLVPEKYMDAQPAKKVVVSGKYMNASEWAIPELEKAETKGLIEPVKGRDFAQAINREQFSEIIMKYYESITGSQVEDSVKNPFIDTTNKEILKAYSLGIVYGKTNKEFKPKELISREEMVVMLKRALDKGMPDFDHKYKYSRFEDESNVSEWAIESVKYVRSLGVATGDTNNNFNPHKNATIQEAVILAYRMLEKSQ